MTIDFMIAAGVMLTAVAGVLVVTLWRRHAVAPEPAAAVDLRVYRDQMRELERDISRGLVSGAEAEALRAEIGRRLLEADRALSAAMGEAARPTDRAAPVGLGLAVVLVLVGGAGALYLALGAPGYGDLPLSARLAQAEERRATRPGQAEAEAQARQQGLMPPPAEVEPRHAELLGQLRAALQQRPDDLAGWQILARNAAGIGDFPTAARAQSEVVRLLADRIRPSDLAAQAELMISAAGGYVSPQAEAVLERLLALSPTDGPGRFYLGLMHLQTGRYDLAFGLWEGLLREGPPGAPWIAPIRAQIEQLAYLAGQHRFSLPAAPAPAGPPARGPSAADIEAAQQMAPEDRMEMIRGMVAGLAERLASEGGPAADWARLIAAYGVLGQPEAAGAIATEAEAVFADRPEDLATIRAAARAAGVAP